VTGDLAAASGGVAACYGFWKWSRFGGWRRTLIAGIGLGFAELCKTTWIILFVAWPAIWLISRCGKPIVDWAVNKRVEPRDDGGRSPKQHLASYERMSAAPSLWRDLCQLGVILLVGLFLINAAYGFDGTFRKLGDYQFVCQALGGSRADHQSSSHRQNRFAGTLFAMLPVPLPKDYLIGIDLQKLDFEGKRWSYLRGEWRLGGWWHYYVCALMVKVPIGLWMLMALSTSVMLNRFGYGVGWRHELALATPLVLVILLVSSQTGFNHHCRYVLPAFPFGFISVSRLARSVPLRHRWAQFFTVFALLWSVESSMWCYPHSLSYFNELTNGPMQGISQLGAADLDSGLDWGQDLVFLQRWLEKHPEARPIGLVTKGEYNPELNAGGYRVPAEWRPEPGWYAVSISLLHDYTLSHERFLEFQPVERIGYSIYIYHITRDDANRVRAKLGLPSAGAAAGLREERHNRTLMRRPKASEA
jgi:hypothetical protein